MQTLTFDLFEGKLIVKIQCNYLNYFVSYYFKTIQKIKF
jgi:hypothetical protein